MAHFERKIKGELIYDGKVVKLWVDDVALENSALAKREYVTHNGGATVLAETEDGILFVEQFRYPYGEVVLELPAGKRDGDENPEHTAVRELEEETGYRAGSITFLGEIYPSPGYTNERLYLYLASELEKSVQHTDEDEFLSVRAIKAEDAERMILDGSIKDAKTVIALLKYFRFYKDKK